MDSMAIMVLLVAMGQTMVVSTEIMASTVARKDTAEMATLQQTQVQVGSLTFSLDWEGRLKKVLSWVFCLSWTIKQIKKPKC